jgi:Icc-related predicted phosphoesterase
MTTELYHISDPHGDLFIYRTIPDAAELLVISGDVFPSFSRGNRKTEPLNQENWFSEVCHEHIFPKFKNRPVITVDGNHDFIELAPMLRKYGYQGPVYQITPEKVIDLGRHKWTGHRYIPYICNEWEGELMIPEMVDVVNKVFSHKDADILVVHTPPDGILSHQFGCPVLANALTYQEHNFKYVFCGHIHQAAGKLEQNGIKFWNSACSGQLVEITP